MQQHIKDALVKIVGKDNFTEELIDMVSYSSDASLNQSRPEAAVSPTTTEQVSLVLKLAKEEGIVITPRGAGTGLSGMAVPVKGGLVLDMARMNKIKSIRIQDRVAVVEPGVVYGDLAKELKPFGFAFPPDPSSGSVATIGGNVATDAGGIKGAKYGTTKNYVMAVEVVLPDGRIMRTGSKCMKSVSGYDLTHLFVGSEGTLGVITEITLKINPIPPKSATAMATFDRLDQAGQAVSEIMYSGILPSVLEIIDKGTLIAINENTNMGLPEVEAILLAETEGHTDEEVQYQMDRVKKIFDSNGASEIRQAKDAKEAEDLWTARKSGYGVLARINKNLLVEDCSVPMSKVAELLRAVEEVAEKYDIVITTVGHAGDGNLHPTICFDASDADLNERAHKAAKELFEKVIALEGTLTGEHGIGLDKAPFMTMEHDPVEMEIMRTFKKVLDPDNRMNPGKMALDG